MHQKPQSISIPNNKGAKVSAKNFRQQHFFDHFALPPNPIVQHLPYTGSLFFLLSRYSFPFEHTSRHQIDLFATCRAWRSLVSKKFSHAWSPPWPPSLWSTSPPIIENGYRDQAPVSDVGEPHGLQRMWIDGSGLEGRGRRRGASRGGGARREGRVRRLCGGRPRRTRLRRGTTWLHPLCVRNSLLKFLDSIYRFGLHAGVPSTTTRDWFLLLLWERYLKEF
jgi:hypothetical protein